MKKLLLFFKHHPRLKKLAHRMLVPAGQARPRLWVRLLVNPFVHHCGRRAAICSHTRIDVLPFQEFSLGDFSTIEDFATINNGVGPVRIGNYSRVGIGNVVIGPVQIGDHVMMAQNVVVSGLNHSYRDVTMPIDLQPVATKPIVIEDECWVGANAVITAGVTLGKHSVVGAGSVVTKNVPPYCVVAGNPATIVQQYDHTYGVWRRTNHAGSRPLTTLVPETA